MTDKSSTPTAIRYKTTTTEIDWADGHAGVYPHEILRGYCPCAECQGHSRDIRFITGGNTTIANIEQVGGYAISIEWGDGHSTGIYSFRYLRALCRCVNCVPPEQAGERPTLDRA